MALLLAFVGQSLAQPSYPERYYTWTPYPTSSNVNVMSNPLTGTPYCQYQKDGCNTVPGWIDEDACCYPDLGSLQCQDASSNTYVLMSAIRTPLFGSVQGDPGMPGFLITGVSEDNSCGDRPYYTCEIVDSGQTYQGKIEPYNDNWGDFPACCYVPEGQDENCVPVTQGSFTGLLLQNYCPDMHNAKLCDPVQRQITPGPNCVGAYVAWRPLASDEPHQVADFEPTCAGTRTHQAFIYMDNGATYNWTSAYTSVYKFTISSIQGTGTVCNDDATLFKPLDKEHLFCDESASLIGQIFNCSILAAAEAQVQYKYDTCAYPTAPPYELPSHTCHSYISDVAAAYQRLST